MTRDLTTGSPMRLIAGFTLPTLLGLLFQQLYNLVDTMIVGKLLGSAALAAVGSSSSLIYLLIAFSQGASVGAGIVVSQFLGAEERENVQDAVHTALAVSVLEASALESFAESETSDEMPVLSSEAAWLSAFTCVFLSGTLFPVLLLVTVPPLDFPSFFGDTR